MEDDLAEKLREENPEQFSILVRMHLSFLIDMNTDEVESPTDKPKSFKWVFSKKSKNGENNQRGGPGPARPAETVLLTEENINQIYQLIDILNEDTNLCQEGIFRRTGALSRQQQLRKLLSSGGSLTPEVASGYSAHDMASVLKGILADTPEPLFLNQHYQAYCHLASTCFAGGQVIESSESRLLGALRLLLLLLGCRERRLARRLLLLLHRAAHKETSNRMAPPALATMFAPHVMCPRRLSPEALHADSQSLVPLLSYMIRRAPVLFTTPTQLATDIAAYRTKMQHRRLLSPPGEELNESVSEHTAASTVFTFVDRQMSGAGLGGTGGPAASAAVTVNATDAALAQLYAHIQALPESHNKKRLIKQFNRENGHGTPLQLQRATKQRSLGESLKKHIFNKNIMNRSVKKPISAQDNRFTYQPMVESPSVSKNNKFRAFDFTSCNTPKKELNIISPKTVPTPTETGESANKTEDGNLQSMGDLEDNKSDGDELDVMSDSNDELDETSLSCDESKTMDKIERLSPKYTSEPNLSFLPASLEGTPKFFKNRNSKIYKSKTLLPSHLKQTQEIGLLQKQNSLTSNEQPLKEKADRTLNIVNSCIKCSTDSYSEIEESVEHSHNCTPKVVNETNVTPRLCKKDSVKYLRSKRASISNISTTPKNASVAVERSVSLEQDVPIKGGDDPQCCTPKKAILPLKVSYLTSTPALGNVVINNERNYENCTTPMYPAGHILRRGSMSPITKSTQKMSKAMQESIMTPRSRKPVVVNCDQLNSLPPCNTMQLSVTCSESSVSDNIYDSSTSLKNDSDFVSTDESCPSTSCHIKYTQINETSNSFKDRSSCSTDPILKERKDKILKEMLYNSGNNKERQSYYVSESNGNMQKYDLQNSFDMSKEASLTDPFRHYLLSRSVLTGSPVDLSFVSGSEDFCDAEMDNLQNISENKMTESLLFCLDGNRPSDLTSLQEQSDRELLLNKSDNASILTDVSLKAQGSPRKHLDNCNKNEEGRTLSAVKLVNKENVSPGNKRSAQSLNYGLDKETKVKKSNAQFIAGNDVMENKDGDEIPLQTIGEPAQPYSNYWDFDSCRCGDLWETNL